jgi:hypothetical protein
MRLNLKRISLNLITFFTFFSFFKVLPIEAEIQPISAVLAIVYILVFDLTSKIRRKIYIPALPYIFVVFLYLIVSVVFISIGKPLQLTYILQSLAIFLAPLAVFLFFINRISSISINVLRVSVYSWTAISFFQALLPSVLSATGISRILESSIARFTPDTVGIGRGVAAFSPEPSYAAHSILLMVGLIFFFYQKNSLRKSEFILMLLCSLFMVVVNQSGTLGFFIAVFALAFGMSELLKAKRGAIKVLAILILSGFIFFVTTIFFPQILEIRFFYIISTFIDSIISRGILNPIEFSDQFGSVRASAVQVGYESLPLTNGAGLGLGGWGSYSVDLAAETHVAKISSNLFIYGDTPIRPYAYASFVSLDLGILGLISLSFMFISFFFLQVKRLSSLSSFSFACLWIFFLGVYYNQPTSLVSHWLFLNIALEAYLNKKPQVNLPSAQI